MPCYEFEGLIPVVDPTAYVHPAAVLIGDVIIEADVYVGPNASLRGDYGRLILQRGSNLQDGCIMHGYCDMDTVVEPDGHIGHGAILHGCVIKRNALVGMNAVVMDGAVVGENSIVAAMSFVKAGFQGEPKQLLMGQPAKHVRDVTEQDLNWKRLNTMEYQALVHRSAKSMRIVKPLTQIETDRARLKGLTEVLSQSKFTQLS
ncbi:carnitine operon protein CaiE [Shewanella pneumatophori]|uniref:Carnitine operon protein CaiE n=1 Tax=Shewanella pneumatophori TaxID=314092 RepID=A0A9X1Z9L0_9GAMM|nr:carnitine operon protein CaiE [Shewanella pneumatophori]MCL1138194.1 carnitine operon protein CaiE [Shewanella pneumatophori]